jgi:DNA-directed RNA polymerase subunit D
MAIEDVEFIKNNSVLYDEIIAHRLGLIPLKTDLKSYNLPNMCKCEGKGCARCQLKLTLKTTKTSGIVYSSELKSKDPAIKPVFDDIPIASLLKGQALELEATAVLGKGKEHVKWKPAHVYYKYKPIIELDNVKNPEAVVESCPVDIFEIKDKKLTVNKDRLLLCNLCEACVDTDEGVKLNVSDTEFIFYIESFGQLNCKEIINQALDIIDAQLDIMAGEIKKSFG